MAQGALLADGNRDVMKNIQQRKKQRKAHYYKHNTGPFQEPLQEKEPIHSHNKANQMWQPGTVIKATKEPRSYLVRSDATGAIYRRTRDHLRPQVTGPTCLQKEENKKNSYIHYKKWTNCKKSKQTQLISYVKLLKLIMYKWCLQKNTKKVINTNRRKCNIM